MRLLNINDVLEYTGFKKSTLYRWIAENRFPQPIKIGDTRSVRWIDKDIEMWINSQMQNKEG